MQTASTERVWVRDGITPQRVWLLLCLSVMPAWLWSCWRLDAAALVSMLGTALAAGLVTGIVLEKLLRSPWSSAERMQSGLYALLLTLWLPLELHLLWIAVGMTVVAILQQLSKRLRHWRIHPLAAGLLVLELPMFLLHIRVDGVTAIANNEAAVLLLAGGSLMSWVGLLSWRTALAVLLVVAVLVLQLPDRMVPLVGTFVYAGLFLAGDPTYVAPTSRRQWLLGLATGALTLVLCLLTPLAATMALIALLSGHAIGIVVEAIALRFQRRVRPPIIARQ